MKQGTNAKDWPPKPWTVVSYQIGGKVGLATRYCAKNLLTGEQKQSRGTYREAFDDIPNEGRYAEPWGV